MRETVWEYTLDYCTEDIKLIADTMHPKTVEEISFISPGLSPLDSLLHCIETADITLMGTRNGVPIGFYGLKTYKTCDVIWFLDSEITRENPIGFAKACKTLYEPAAVAFAKSPYIIQFVLGTYTQALRLMEFLGYRALETVDINGAPFVMMGKEVKDYGNIRG